MSSDTSLTDLWPAALSMCLHVFFGIGPNNNVLILTQLPPLQSPISKYSHTPDTRVRVSRAARSSQ